MCAMEPSTPQADPLSDSEVEAALAALSEADWSRARKFARLCLKGLVGMDAGDLLHEVVVKLLDRTRTWPRGLPALIVIGTAMQSVASNARKKNRKGPIDQFSSVDTVGENDGEGKAIDATAVDERTPESAAIVRDELEAIYGAVKDDEELGLLVMAWGDGIRGAQAAAELGMEMKVYEAARKRLTRILDSLANARK
jgi:hypothetical protein